CACGYIRQSAIDDMVLATLQQEFGDQVARERCTEKARAEARAAMQRAQEGMAGAQRAIARIAEQESRIRRMFREGGLTVAEYRELRADMAAERSDQQTRLQQLQSAAAEAEGSLLLTQREVELFGRIQELRSLPPEQQKHLLRHFAAAITLYRRQGSSEIVCDMLWRWAETRAAESLQTVLTQP
ncbi:MAG TPA: hypothetical protein VD902_05720, partial [Symbiobacteriaceae bacterium]|nr:hypothetical protein [Symbiobacteriaceae bacterium]